MIMLHRKFADFVKSMVLFCTFILLSDDTDSTLKIPEGCLKERFLPNTTHDVNDIRRKTCNFHKKRSCVAIGCAQ